MGGWLADSTPLIQVLTEDQGSEHLHAYLGNLLIFEVQQIINGLRQQSVHAWIQVRVLFCEGTEPLDG